MKIKTMRERAEALLEQRGLQVPGRTLPRGAQWTGADIPDRGQAAARRLQQMAKGQIPRLCESCQTDVVPKERVLRLCDACLELKWTVDGTNSVDSPKKVIVV